MDLSLEPSNSAQTISQDTEPEPEVQECPNQEYLELTNSTSEGRKRRPASPNDSKRRPKTIADATAKTIAQL